MAVSAGDRLTCLICVHAGSTTSATIFLGNTGTHVGSFFSVTAPPGISLRGNCAEWIVEALETGPSGAPELAPYTTVDFSECYAGTVGGHTILGGSGNTINMVDSSNRVISEGLIVTPTIVRVFKT